MVIAIMKSHRRDKFEEGPSGPAIKCSCGAYLSIKWIVPAPMAKPMAVTHTPPRFIAGTMRLNDEAASMTPAAKPSIMSRVLSDIFLINSTGNAPMPVANPARRLAMNPSLIISILILVLLLP